MNRSFCSLVLFITVIFTVKAAKILCVYQAPFLSHQIAFRSITEEFLRRGHEVDVVTTDPAYVKGQTPKNLTEIDIHDITHNIWTKSFVEDKSGKKESISSQLKSGLDIIVDIVMSQYGSDQWQDFLKTKKKLYDIVLVDAAFPPSVIFSHLYKVPFVKICTFGVLSNVFSIMGVPRHILYYPETLRNRSYNITSLEMYGEIYNDLLGLWRFDANYKTIYEKVSNSYIPDLPTFDELNNNVNMLFVNMNPVWEGIRPYPPNYIGVHGFIHKSKKVIPQDIQSYLDSSKNGVIFASFGTSVVFSLLPEYTISVIFKVFSQLPYQVLLRCDKDDLPGRSENVKLFKWLPQAEVLKHPKIKLFITQGGQHSIDEAIEAGVPMIVIPQVFDQFANSERCVHHGIGAKVDLKIMSQVNFMDAIKNIVDDKRYRENIVKLRTILQDTPMKSMDRLMWAIDYMIRHRGAQHMRSPSANLSWTEFFELELLCIFLSIILSILIIIVMVLLAVKRYCVVRVIRRGDQLYEKID